MSIEVNGLPPGNPTLGDLIHFNDVSNLNNSFSATMQQIIELYNSHVATLFNKSISGSNNTFTNIPQSAVTSLVSDLALKSDVSHVHDTSDITTGIMATSRLGTGTADATTFLRGDGVYALPPGAGGGEVNTNSNTIADSATEKGLVKTKVGLDTPIKVIRSGANVTVTEDADAVTIAATGGGSGEINTNSNTVLDDATHVGLVLPKVGVDTPIKVIESGSGITVTPTATSVVVAATGGGGGEANTASNLAADTATIKGLFSAKNVLDLEFKSIEVGAGLTITDNSDRLTIESTSGNPTIPLIVAASDELNDLTTGTDKVTFRMPAAYTLTGIRCSVTEAPQGQIIQVQVNENGNPILSTPLSIDTFERTSVTAATPPVIGDPNLGDDSEITIDILQVGTVAAGKGLKVTFIGNYV